MQVIEGSFEGVLKKLHSSDILKSTQGTFQSQVLLELKAEEQYHLLEE